MITVLAGNIQDAMRFGQRAGLGRVRTIQSQAAAEGLTFDVILELPSYRTRRDRFAIEGALSRGTRRFAPTIRMLIDVDQYDEVMADPAKPEAYPVQTTVDDQVALAEADRMRRLSAFEQGGPVVERTAPTDSVEQAVADAGTRPVDPPEPTPDPEFKPRSRKRTPKAT